MLEPKTTLLNSPVEKNFTLLLIEVLVTIRFNFASDGCDITSSHVHTAGPEPDFTETVGIEAEWSAHQGHKLTCLPQEPIQFWTLVFTSSMFAFLVDSQLAVISTPTMDSLS